MTHNEIRELEHRSIDIRKTTIDIVTRSKASHLGGSLSVVDILTALYFKIMNIDSININTNDRDKLILSKGHCCSALYSTLAHKGFIKIKGLERYCSDNGKMWGHATLNCILGVDATSGSLGHGLPIGLGMALANKIKKNENKVFVVLSDGECQEGTVWEAAMIASQLKLDNLIVIIDYNKLQAFGYVKDVVGLEPFSDKWSSFGWSVKNIDGNDIHEIVKSLEKIPFEKSKPSIIIANTIKGKGVSFMEDKLEWHYKCPNKEEQKIAIDELNSRK